MSMSITIIGTGLMGSAFARTLSKAGHRVTVWNRTLSKAEKLKDAGVAFASSLAQALEAGEVIISLLRDYAASAELLSSSDLVSHLRGKIFVELTSGSPVEARHAADFMANHGIKYVDGAVLATPDLIGTDQAVIILSCENEVAETVMAALDTVGSPRIVGDDPGRANALDVANLSMMWGNLFGTVQAIAVCQAEGMDPDVLSGFLAESLPVVQAMAQDLIHRASAGRYASDESTIATIATHASALGHLAELVAARNLDDSIVKGYQSLFAKAVAAGQLEADFAAMVPFMAKQ